jgi:hypothetical protein
MCLSDQVGYPAYDLASKNSALAVSNEKEFKKKIEELSKIKSGTVQVAIYQDEHNIKAVQGQALVHASWFSTSWFFEDFHRKIAQQEKN